MNNAKNAIEDVMNEMNKYEMFKGLSVNEKSTIEFLLRNIVHASKRDIMNALQSTSFEL